MTKAEAPKFFILPLLSNQTPQGDVHCRVTEALERDSGAACGRSFLAGVFLSVVAAANIAKSMKNCSSHGFVGRGPQPVLLLLCLLGEMSHHVLQTRAQSVFGAAGVLGHGSSWSISLRMEMGSIVVVRGHGLHLHESRPERGHTSLCLPLVPFTPITGTLR